MSDTESSTTGETFCHNIHEKYVSGRKYESIKEKAHGWREKALEYIKMYEEACEENNKLTEENNELHDKFMSLMAKNEKQKELLIENKNLTGLVEEYKEKYKKVRKTLKQLEKEREEERLLDKLSRRVANKQ